jgi:hypothetical protein
VVSGGSGEGVSAVTLASFLLHKESRASVELSGNTGGLTGSQLHNHGNTEGA